MMHKNSQDNKYLWLYFILVIVLMIPFWVFGNHPLPLPINLPVSALGFVVPVGAAMIAAALQNGVQGVKSLVRRALDYRAIKNKVWLLVALLLAPIIYYLSYTAMRVFKMPLTQPEIPWLILPVFFTLFLIAAAGEELGWTAYAIDPLQNRWGALIASLLLGTFWAGWHIIPWVQTHNPAGWIFWQAFGTVLMRVIIVWICNNAGKSALAAIVYHAASNLSWTFFPNFGSNYDPFVTAMVMVIVLIVILIGWDARTFSRFRINTDK